MATSLSSAIPQRSAPPAELWVGGWLVRPAANEIARAGNIVRLEPKAMEVLVFLAERHGEVVSRDALLSAVWPDTIVGDDALTQAVIKLRKALGDPSRSPQYIETISKRGYRLIAAVDRRDCSPGTNNDAIPGLELGSYPQAAMGHRFKIAIVLTSLLFAVIAGGALFVWLGQTDTNEGASATDVPHRWGSLPTIGVAPFETIGADGAETYLALGIAADLATDLSRLAGLRAINLPRSESGKGDTGSSLVRYLISGTVQRTQQALRINVRLVDTATKAQLWAERYDRPFNDLIAVQEEIIARLLAVLPIRVSDAERQRLARRYTRNLQAYDFFLRGKAAFLARQATENRTAREMYQKAIDLDPTFARAYAGLALTHADDYRNRWTDNGQQSLAKALNFAQGALRIDPELPEVYAVLGYAHALQLDYESAIKHVEKAIELDRSYADAYAYLGAFYTHTGEAAKAIPMLRTAMRLNPDAGFIYFLVLGRAYLAEGDLEQATINLKEALRRNAADLEARLYMAATLVAAGDMVGAHWEVEEIRVLQPDFSLGDWLRTSPIGDARQKEQLTGLLGTVGL